MWNIERRLQGWKNSPLTERGLERAEKLKLAVENIDFDAIYSSDLHRAVKTAEIIAGKRNIEVQQIVELREIAFGAWEGKRLEDIEKNYPVEFDTYMNNPTKYKSIDGESMDELFDRVEKGFKKIVDTGGENVLIVAHGVTIKALIAIIKGLDRSAVSEFPVFPGTSLSVYKKNNDLWEVELEADTSHFEKGTVQNPTLK